MTTTMNILSLNLTRSEQKLLRVLIANADENRQVCLSRPALVDLAGISQRSVNNAVASLAEARVLSVERRCQSGRGAAGNLPNVYTLSDTVGA